MEDREGKKRSRKGSKGREIQDRNSWSRVMDWMDASLYSSADPLLHLPPAPSCCCHLHNQVREGKK